LDGDEAGGASLPPHAKSVYPRATIARVTGLQLAGQLTTDSLAHRGR
jgi:hypothetical protein